MSFEGFYQLLCRNGHYHEENVHVIGYMPIEEWRCPVCDEPVKWWNIVDETNGMYDTDDEGNENADIRIDGYIELEIDKLAVICEKCPCGVKHQVAPPTYKIPAIDDVGHRL
jgi:hypothetical protein